MNLGTAPKPTLLKRRLLKLQSQGFNVSQLSRIANMSYTATYKYLKGTLTLGDDREMYGNAAISEWAKRIAKI